MISRQRKNKWITFGGERKGGTAGGQPSGTKGEEGDSVTVRGLVFTAGGIKTGVEKAKRGKTQKPSRERREY